MTTAALIFFQAKNIVAVSLDLKLWVHTSAHACVCVCVCVFKIYLFIELSWVFVAARGLFSSCSETGLFSNCSAQASHCDGSPYCRAWLSAHRLQKLQLVGSLVAALGH